MDNVNVAYDLTIYEEQVQTIERADEQRSKTVKLKTGMNYGFKRMCGILTAAVTMSLVIAVLSTNASITECTNDIAQKQNAIVQLESEKSYLNFTIESRMSLKNVEEYAVGTLGLVKMDSAQVEYITIEEENKIEVTEPFKSTLSKAVKPILSYLLP